MEGNQIKRDIPRGEEGDVISFLLIVNTGIWDFKGEFFLTHVL